MTRNGNDAEIVHDDQNRLLRTTGSFFVFQGGSNSKRFSFLNTHTANCSFKSLLYFFIRESLHILLVDGLAGGIHSKQT